MGDPSAPSETDASESRRVAVTHSVTLSGQLVQGALALLTILGAYIAYALAARDTRAGFEFVALLTSCFFGASIFAAGRAITSARNEGFAGRWSLEAGKRQFNLQAIFLLLALLSFVVVLLLSGQPKESDAQKRTAELAASLQVESAKREEIVARLEGSLKQTADVNARLEAQIAALRAEFLAHAHKRVIVASTQRPSACCASSCTAK